MEEGAELVPSVLGAGGWDAKGTGMLTADECVGLMLVGALEAPGQSQVHVLGGGGLGRRLPWGCLAWPWA